YKDGENIVRLFGGVLPRYVYWLKGTNGKDIPVECLAFDREKEKFNNLEHDHVPEFFPDKKCSWSYSINCIDIKNNKVVALNLKKKLFEQIISLAGDLEADPTDPDEGWDVVFKRQKTGPLPFNVEYTLSQIKSKKRKLTAEEREMIANAKDIDSKFPHATAEEVKANLEKILAGGSEEEAAPGTDGEAVKELG
ncbi:hypothetical protein MUP59_05595, partial [Candidatus Bathyarchaeota archaeon]|nr:hypothetical protein [Candidatus Bathyarchaeota archaeon]